MDKIEIPATERTTTETPARFTVVVGAAASVVTPAQGRVLGGKRQAVGLGNGFVCVIHFANRQGIRWIVSCVRRPATVRRVMDRGIATRHRCQARSQPPQAERADRDQDVAAVPGSRLDSLHTTTGAGHENVPPASLPATHGVRKFARYQSGVRPFSPRS